jgi:hypothetical protein
MTHRTLQLLLLAAVAFCGCHSSSAASASNSTSSADFVEFKDRDSWIFTKEQRWSDIQKYVQDNSTSLIRDDQQAAITYAHDAGLTTPAQLQDHLDGFERRRSGNPNAHSCRIITDVAQPYNYSYCTQQQLTAELFQESEEFHHYN